MDRNLALELVRVTEAAALVSSKFMGRGDKNGADGAAVEAMRRAFESVKIKGEVVIGEGEIDEAPMLYIGEKVGSQEEGTMEVDIAVDPLDGTELIAKGLPNAIAVIAMGKKGSLLNAPDAIIFNTSISRLVRSDTFSFNTSLSARLELSNGIREGSIYVSPE